MIKTSPAAPKPSPIPSDLNSLFPQRETPWNVSSSLFNRIKSQNSSQHFKLCEILNSDFEFNFILKYFEYHKPSGYSIKRIVCIHNPDHTQVFEGTLKNMERESNNPVFAPKGKEEEPKVERARALTRWEKQVAQFSPVEIKSSTSRDPDSCSKAKVLPLWHGSSQEVCESVCFSGFTSFGKHHYFDESAQKGNTKSTDKGYFGSGIYFTNSAQYASMYSQGHLLLSWVSMREPYPVVSDVPHPNKCTDMTKLGGKEHYQNYNAHYIPVASIKPEDPKCLEYYPCYKDQPPAWDEFVVFHASQTLPRFWIELGVDLPTVVLSTLLNAGELLTLVLTLLDKEEIKNNAALSAVLQTKADHLLGLAETTPLNPEEEKFFKLAKRVMSEGEKVSSAVVTMLLKSGSPSIDSSPLKNSSPSVAELPSNNSSVIPLNTQKPEPLSPAPISVSLGDEDYQNGCSSAKSGDLEQAFFNYQKAAEKGHSEAQYRIARCYKLGEGTSKDEKKAEEWYRKAAAQGHLVAKGFCFYCGYGVLQDFKEAVKWYQKAADQGDAFAQHNLGICYYNGQGVARDFKEAVKWYQKAADQGLVGAQHNLGVCYDYGQGVAQDYNKAAKWYQKAADQGYASAQEALQTLSQKLIPLGVSPTTPVLSEIPLSTQKPQPLSSLPTFVSLGEEEYQKGSNYAKSGNLKQAFLSYQKAADQGYASAQIDLGVYYQIGQGVAQDYKEAVKWFQKAADQGNAIAQFNLGCCYKNGEGVAQDYKEAVKWFQKAADQGYPDAQKALIVLTQKPIPLGISTPPPALSNNFPSSNLSGNPLNIQKPESFSPGALVHSLEKKKHDFLSYKKAAEEGHVEAQYRLARCYKKGEGTSIHEKKAEEWYRRAAAQGHLVAKGECYYYGYGVLQDYKEAVKWFQKAANQGNADAQKRVKELEAFSY